jgi:hypothetical protein
VAQDLCRLRLLKFCPPFAVIMLLMCVLVVHMSYPFSSNADSAHGAGKRIVLGNLSSVSVDDD